MRERFQFAKNPWFIFTLVIIGALCTRVVYEGTQAWERGVVALQDGDDEEAIFQFRTAGRWTMPGFEVPQQALTQLMGIGENAFRECEKCPDTCTVESAKDCNASSCKSCAKAVFAFDSVRAAILGSRSFYTPQEALLEKANEQLSQSLARAAEVYEPGPRQSRSTRESRLNTHRQQMLIDHAPANLPAFIACFGFLFWIGGFALFLRKGGLSSGETKPESPVLWRFLTASGIGFISWVSALFFL